MRGTQEELNLFNSAIESLTTLRNSFEVETVEPDPDPEPVLSPDVEQLIRNGAGARGTLRTIASQADLAANGLPGSWSNNNWTCPSCPTQWVDLDVKGIIYYTGTDTLKLVNVKCQGVQYKVGSVSPGGWFMNSTIVEKPGWSPGQGGINFVGQKNWTIDSCDISGFADGCQGVGPGVIMNSWIHGLLFTTSTHNDGFQNYGGRIEVHMCVYDMGEDVAAMQDHCNGALFTSSDGASFEAWDLYVNCPSAPRINALNGARGPIVVHSGKIVGGQLPGQVTLDPAVVRIP